MFVYLTHKRAAVTLALLAATAGAIAQDKFPSKPVRIIVTEAGGSSDLYTRTLAQALNHKWNRPVIVENRPSVMAIEAAIRAQPDGYSLLCYASSLWIGPLMGRGTYDAFKDLTPVTIAVASPNVLVVHPSVPAKSVKELIALAKARPGVLNYSAGGLGSGGHIAGEMFNSMAGVNIVRVSFKGAGPATNAVVGGEVQMLFATIGSVGAHVKAGKLRALGVGSLKPSTLVPDLPTVASTLPGFESTLIQGIFAPAKMSPVLIRKIQQDIVASLAQDDVKERYLAMSAEVVGSTPEALSSAMKTDVARLTRMIKEGSIKLE